MPGRAELGFLILSLVVASCATTVEVREEPPPPPPVEEPAPEPTTFRTQTDTLHSAAVVDAAHPVDRRNPEIRFMVQVGAFRDAANASRVQEATRERFRMPVVNDYNLLKGVYQIRIGFFETREAAAAFRDRIVREYPREYGDSWVVPLTP